jgi:hypothetical protein
VVDQRTYNREVRGSNLAAAGTGRRKYFKIKKHFLKNFSASRVGKVT